MVSSRITFITVFMASIVLFASYGGTLTSFLTVTKLTLPFTSLRELYYSTNYALHAKTGGALEDTFKVKHIKQLKIVHQHHDLHI